MYAAGCCNSDFSRVDILCDAVGLDTQAKQGETLKALAQARDEMAQLQSQLTDAKLKGDQTASSLANTEEELKKVRSQLADAEKRFKVTSALPSLNSEHNFFAEFPCF